MVVEFGRYLIFYGLKGMEILEMRRCRGVWVHRREVASFKRGNR